MCLQRKDIFSQRKFKKSKTYLNETMAEKQEVQGVPENRNPGP